MKQWLIFAGLALAALQTLLILAVMAAAARPVPKFEPEQRPVVKKPRTTIRERDLELVA